MCCWTRTSGRASFDCSRRVTRAPSTYGPSGWGGAADMAIWQHAAEQGFVLATKDEDFHRLSVFQGFPPKVLWVRLGNCTTAEVAALLERHRSAVIEFVAHPEIAFLALG
ncbi:MAG TPA: DUF5615 family PIN-like protein [Gemmatimonadaceae bacterium]|nr:DUF5615 family PIN-like protein [Gemmatimonadaceae bacterium]